MQRFQQLSVLLAAALLPPAACQAQGTIVYHQPAQPLSGLVGLQVDVDGNGQTDLRFYDASYLPASYWATDASGVGSARLLVVPHSGVDGGSHLAALNSGFLIGATPGGSLLWAAQDAPNAYGDAVVIGSYSPEISGGSLTPVGYFYGTTAFMGIEFQIGSDWHYGWLRIRGGVAGPSDDGQTFYLNPPGWILDWAYETRPDTPILAGAVPEPSSWAMLLIGVGVLLLRRRR